MPHAVACRDMEAGAFRCRYTCYINYICYMERGASPRRRIPLAAHLFVATACILPAALRPPQVVVRETAGWTEVRETQMREWDFTGCFEPDAPLPPLPATLQTQVASLPSPAPLSSSAAASRPIRLLHLSHLCTSVSSVPLDTPVTPVTLVTPVTARRLLLALRQALRLRRARRLRGHHWHQGMGGRRALRSA